MNILKRDDFMTDNHQEEINPEAIKIIDNKEPAEISLKPKKKDNVVREIFNYVVIILIAFVLAQIIHKYVFTPVTVYQHSMMNNLHEGDILFLWRPIKVERFDIYVFEKENELDETHLIKRIIGLPGDEIRMENYNLYINNKLVNEPYLDSENINLNNTSRASFTLAEICQINSVNCNEDGKTRIPEGYYLVLGDNRNSSRDSRDFGLIEEDQLRGEAKFIIYPFNRFGKIGK